MMAVKKYKSERLNALLGKPERAVEADEARAVESGLLVMHGKREGGKLERGSTDLAFRTFVEYAHALGYGVEVRLVPGDKERSSLSATLTGDGVQPYGEREAR